MLRRLIIGLGGAVGVLIGGASPAMAQSIGGGDSTLLPFIGSIAGGIALGLLFAILFGPSRGVERDLSGRLGVYADTSNADRGFFGKIPVLRAFSRRAENMAHDRGVFSMIETALEQANVPVCPGEAITMAIGLSLVLGFIVLLMTGNAIAALIFAQHRTNPQTN